MILQGNQRAGGQDLAAHLLKTENEHVDVHEVRGFIAQDLHGAFREAYAMSKCTRAKQYLFSLSLNPPPEANVATASFEEAIEQIESTLGLSGQPRAIVFHEKQGRRHCHAVWSRTKASEGKAVPLPHTKRKLMEISRGLYIKHGWEMPRGMVNSQERDPTNFTLAQWQQAKRIGKDPKAIKQNFQDCWSMSDNRSSFEAALKSRGYYLAKGDRRGFVALDCRCEVFAVAKWVGVKTKDVRAKLGEEKELPSVETTKTRIASEMQERLTSLSADHNEAIARRKAEIEKKRKAMMESHQHAREALKQKQTQRQAQERRERQSRFRTGLRGLMDRVTGRHKHTRKANEQDFMLATLRDRKERDHLIFQQLEARRTIEQRQKRLEQFTQYQQQDLSRDIQQFNELAKQQREYFERLDNSRPNHAHSRDGPGLEI